MTDRTLRAAAYPAGVVLSVLVIVVLAVLHVSLPLYAGGVVGLVFGTAATVGPEWYIRRRHRRARTDVWVRLRLDDQFSGPMHEALKRAREVERRVKEIQREQGGRP